MRYLVLVLLVLISGCAQQQSVSDICVKACKSATSLESGPCLLDPIEGSDYVCDVAHNPREEIDNKIENQCKAYPSRAKHFIEVSPDCKIIRSV